MLQGNNCLTKVYCHNSDDNMSVKAFPPLLSDAVKTSVGSMMFFVCECVLALVLILGLKVAVNNKNKWTLSL